MSVYYSIFFLCMTITLNVDSHGNITIYFDKRTVVND